MKSLFSFEGRVNRAKFWLVVLGVLVAEGIVFGGLAAMMGPDGDVPGGLVAVAAVFVLVIVWVNLATMAKRYHDRNKSGWWIFIILVPLVGPIWNLVECGFLPGTTGPNQYGADPLAKA
ncbi:MAG TPA: DUF805 domain-containing protein [Reyranella sp.]|jgi:uncharacterized membrane protein YhaH (DUF805 family)|nr:DUF805 domain-containing protein [Reyranella sp.]